ncbi:hypothetical protein J40TS1_12450 [Paenibacillus montaniterrae]|uniref:PDZ domain-containing protein n=1 Tax=Paenibacillus montaniterrae TaxID=429341 RepID=A0A919YRH4_9BACL|nr:trypsin-like peptidase domain-containing protein [Paenibacillus montaniterrae]GIP15603.1 hypothetical protein J40TS1_12450 [Paenibacillus montaniterrae]
MNNDNRDKFFENEQGKTNAAGQSESGTQQSSDNYEHTKPYAPASSSYSEPSKPGIEDAEYTPIDNSSVPKQEPIKSQGPTYYSYGQTRPMQTVQPSYPAHDSSSPYNGAANVQGAAAQYGTGYSAAAQQSASIAAPVRPFTTSSGGGDPLSAKKEKNRSGGFGKMFLSFMAGVVVVGLLMYTADVQNWFSNEAVVSQNNSYNSGSSGGGSTSSGGTATGTTSSLPMDRPDNISELFTASSPAVVKIETFSKPARNSANSLFNDPFFRQFFGNSIPNNEQENSQELQQTGMGTGFFFESSGYILTNQHVISDAEEIRVIVEGYEEPFIATQLGSSYELDLAVLKIEGDQAFPTLPLGNSNDTKIGDWVLAIGNPNGFDHTLTVGVISAKERPIDIPDSEGTRHYQNLLQTDASINPGNSGGPLLNMNGEVIGINTAVSSTAQGIGFAIPTSTITEVLESLKNNEALPVDASPFIGVDLQDLTENLATQLGLDSTDGSIVRNVYYNSPAYKGGMKQYDVIVSIDGKEMKKTTDITGYIGEKAVGDVIELTVIRDGEKVPLPIEIGDKNQFGL